MKSLITLILSSIVVFFCGNFFGWWKVPVPGLEGMPTYHQRRDVREAKRMERRRRVGLEDDEDGEGKGKLTNKHAKRRAEALRNGGGINDVR